MKIGNNLHLDASRVLEKRGDGHPRNPSVFPALTSEAEKTKEIPKLIKLE